MIAAIPLTVIPLILFNILALTAGATVWNSEILAIPMLSGAAWSLKAGDLMIVLGLALLFVEVLKAARSATNTIANHIFSTVVLIVYIIQFIVSGIAANSLFFILTAIALFDVIAGFSISIRTASRDIAFGPHVDAHH